MIYPLVRLVPQGNTAQCKPCARGRVTYWPMLDDALKHYAEVHEGATTRHKISAIAATGTRTFIQSTGGSITLDGVKLGSDVTAFDLEGTELDAKNVRTFIDRGCLCGWHGSDYPSVQVADEAARTHLRGPAHRGVSGS